MFKLSLSYKATTDIPAKQNSGPEKINQNQLTGHAVVKLSDSLNFEMLQRRPANFTKPQVHNL